MVIALVMLQLTIVGVVVAGARDEDLTVQRVDTHRAFYAAEAGANMAMREVILNVDADSDGAIGTISNDGNAANDPALGTAYVYVSSSISGPAIILSSQSRSGAARRRIDITVQ